MNILHEDNRQELISKSKSSQKGRQRFNRRNKSKVKNTVKEMNSINMDKLFKQDILTVNIPVQGETNDYIVKITFGGFLQILKDQLRGEEREIDFRDISRAAIIGFNKDDVYIFCSCPDFHYRYGYWATKNQLNSGTPETRPSNITNPNDSLGSGCKHILLVLNNNSWIIRVARVIMNYIKYMQKHYEKLYADIIYPAIYGKAYEEPVQLTLDDIENNDKLATDDDTEIIDTASDYAKDSTRFKKGNTQGIRFSAEDSEEDQLSFESNEEENPDDQL